MTSKRRIEPTESARRSSRKCSDSSAQAQLKSWYGNGFAVEEALYSLIVLFCIVCFVVFLLGENVIVNE
jgi:hypothetical protein